MTHPYVKSHVKDLSIKQVNWFVASVTGLDMSVEDFLPEYQNGFYYNLEGYPQPIPNYVQGAFDLFPLTLDSLRINLSYNSQKCYASIGVVEGGDIIQEGASAREAAYRCLIQLFRGDMVVLPKPIERS